MQMAYGVRQGHVEGFRSKKEENISSRAVYVQDCSSGTKKNAEIILPRIIYTSLRKSCPMLLGGLSQKDENSDTHRNESLTFLDRVAILSRRRSRIQWVGFLHEGHGPQCKKCMGTLDPRCFPAGTWILPTLKFSSKSMRLKSLGVCVLRELVPP